MSARFFSFGCSFTQYSWPTWADILGRDYEHFENWGSAGAGNHFIFYSLIEAIGRRKIAAGDTVGIMWTSTHREDRFIKGKWQLTGSVYCSSLPQEYIDNWTDSNHYLLTSVKLIAAAKKILDALGSKYWFFSMVPLNDSHEPTTKKPYKFIPRIESGVSNLYKSALDTVRPSMYEAIFNYDWDSRNTPIPAAQQAQINMFRSDYEKVADIEWPAFDDFMCDNLCHMQTAVRDKISKDFRFFERRNKILHERPDFHPVPSEHAQYLEKNGFTLSKNQLAFVDYWDHQVATQNKFTYKPSPIDRF